MIVCVAANPSVDKLFEVERLRPGTIHRPTAFVQVPGGKGLNVARAAAALGADVRAVALLGGHAGRWVAEALAAEEVPCHAVWVEGETRASVSVADREAGGLTEFYERGAEVSAAPWTALVSAAAELAAEASWVTVSGSLPVGAPLDGYRDLIRGCRQAGARVALDASGESLRLALQAGPDVVKVNAAEGAQLFTGAEGEAARELRRMTGGEGHAGLVTLGAGGVVAALPDGTAVRGRLPVRAPYPVGSGDAFLAGLVVALDRGDPWPDALRVALAAAVANAEVPGAGRLDPSRARALVTMAALDPIA